MLTHAYINKVARLMDQIGELRPGFLQDAATPLEGSMEPCSSVGGKRAQVRSSKGIRSVRVWVAFETDEATGEIRAVQK